MRSSPSFAIDGVVTAAAGHYVVAQPAVELVGAPVTVDVVVAALGEQSVVAAAAEHGVARVRAVEDVVVPGPADGHGRRRVVVGLADDHRDARRRPSGGQEHRD
jgi:hypothetical protein